MDEGASRAYPRSRALRHPIARGDAFAHRIDVLRALTQSELRIRYGRGYFTFVRWLLEPVALVGVYLILLAFVLDRPGRAPGLSIACSIVPFQLVMLTVGNAMTAVSMRGPILSNMRFERTLIPVSAALTEGAAFTGSLPLIVLMMAAYRVAPTWNVLWLPLVIASTLVLAVAFAYPASLFGIWFRELRSFGQSFVRMLFFLGPGLVPLSQTSGHAHTLLQLNPLTGLFEAYRDVFLYGDSPSLLALLYPVAFGIALLAAFVPLYRVEQREFAKVVA